VKDAHGRSYQFWLPILALYTGCRLEELAQLYLDDIQQADGVWVIDINNQGDKKIKTPSSLRRIPVHPFLQSGVNLIGYAEALKRKGEERLFPELRRRRDGDGMTASKWFARYKTRCGIVENGAKKDFHSFRHTFVNTLKQALVEETMIAELVGHAVDSMTMGRYGKRYTPKILLEHAVLKLNYPLDLSHIKTSRFTSVKA
jgi:integrase